MCTNPNARLLVRLIIDVTILIVVFVVALVVLPIGLRTQTPIETETTTNATTKSSSPFALTRRGFFCSDDSLSYPYQPETLLNKVHITLLTIAVPAAVILTVEMLRAGLKRVNGSSTNGAPTSASPLEFSFVGLRIPTLISECYQLMGAYLFGLGLLLITTTLLKHWTGRLRPYFFDVCQPQLPNGSTCNDDENLGVYIEEYACSELATVSVELLATLRQSFPSGYVTCAAYALGFLAFYLQARLRTSWLRLLRTLLQFVGVAIVVLVAMERLNSMRHHWTDVVAAVVLGWLFAAFVAFAVLRLFFRKSGKFTWTGVNGTTRRRKPQKYF